MDDVREKIAKLLALAESPNENEAKLALLKARELMAQHKLRPEECKKNTNEKLIRELIGPEVSKTKYAWAPSLSAVIAENYCCRSYRSRNYGERMYKIGIIGMEEDFAICKRVFLYAFDCVKTRCDEIFREGAELGYSAKYRRQRSEDYGLGFVRGVSAAFRRQNEEKEQVWGLVMVTPQPVLNELSTMRAGKVFKQASAYGSAYREGMEDGKRFDPAHRIESSGEARAALNA